MLDLQDLGMLQWQCAYVYVCRHRAALTDADLKVLRVMRYYFRTNERPPQSLALRAMGIVSLFKGRQKAPTRRLKLVMTRKARAEAFRIRAMRERLTGEAAPA